MKEERIVVVIDADGSMSAKTSGIKGTRCIEELEQLLDQLAEVDDVEHTVNSTSGTLSPVNGRKENSTSEAVNNERGVARTKHPDGRCACALEAFAAIGGRVTTACPQCFRFR